MLIVSDIGVTREALHVRSLLADAGGDLLVADGDVCVTLRAHQITGRWDELRLDSPEGRGQSKGSN